MSHRPTALALEPVTAITTFRVPATEAERILARWRENAAIMAAQPGFIRAWVYDSPAERGHPRLVHLAHWDSKEALDKAGATPKAAAAIPRILNDPGLCATDPPAVYQGRVHGRGPWRLMRDPVRVEVR